ncbi:MAG: DUF1835 domain-containing protein [Collinsella intestinalis]|nr:DUF1835 domain-containing protein [Collinsella intestinalis]
MSSVLRAARAAAIQQGECFGDVLWFPDNLTIGRLSPFTAKSRLSELSRIEGVFKADREKSWNEFHERLSAVDGEIRAWSTNATHEKLALCYTCSILHTHSLKLLVLERKYPENMDWDKPFPITTTRIHLVDCRSCANEWNEVVATERDVFDRRIRICENNRIKSVPENHFDLFVRDYLSKCKLDDGDVYTMLPFLMTDEIERVTGNLILPEFFSIRLCRIFGYDRNPWCPTVGVW